MTDAYWEYEEAEAILASEGKYDRTYGRYPVTISKDIGNPAYRPAAYVPQNGIGITDNCPDPVRAIKFFDYLCQEDTQILTDWGFEGVNWEIRDGRRAWTAEEIAQSGTPAHSIETGIGMMTYPWPCIGAALDSNGYKMSHLDDDEALMEAYNVEAKATLAAYGADTWKSLFPPATSFKPSEWGQAWNIWDSQPPDTDFSILMNECYDLTAQYLPIVCSAAPAEFDAKWDEFMQRLKDTGVDKLGELGTEVLKNNFFTVWAEEEEE